MISIDRMMDEIEEILEELRESDLLMEYPDTPSGDYQLAHALVARLSEAIIRELAVAHLRGVISGYRRQVALMAEREATRVVRAGVSCYTCDEWYTDDAAYAAHKKWRRGERSHCALTRERKAEERRQVYVGREWEAPRNSLAYKRWVETPNGQKHVEQERLRRLEQEAKDRLYREDPVAWDDKYGLSGAIHRFTEAIREEVRIELTEELLGSTFALGDGHRVTWAEATRAHHQQRISLLERNVIGNVDALKRHYAALRLLQESDVETLGDVAVERELRCVVG